MNDGDLHKALQEIQGDLDEYKEFQAKEKKKSLRMRDKELAEGKRVRGHNDLAQLLYLLKDDKETLFVELVKGKDVQRPTFLYAIIAS